MALSSLASHVSPTYVSKWIFASLHFTETWLSYCTRNHIFALGIQLLTGHHIVAMCLARDPARGVR
jgi:hypothetical protein